jgi:hypothetical protein
VQQRPEPETPTMGNQPRDNAIDPAPGVTSDTTDPANVKAPGYPPDPTARAADDETLAAEARARFRRQGLVALEPDGAIRPLLGPGECVFGWRREAVLDRRQPSTPDAREGVSGALYLTSDRLVLVGRPVVEIDLECIAEVGIAGERLFLVLADGSSAAIDVDTPRLLRVEISATRAAARSAT